MGAMVLAALTAADVEAARQWRNDDSARLGLRTPYLLTEAMQRRFYEDVVSDRHSVHRYWAVRREGVLVAMAGITDLQWENGHGEISLVVDPARQGEGIGAGAVGLVLQEAFERMRLLTVFGECYVHNPALGFWRRMVERLGGGSVTVPRRKWWEGRLHDAMLFWFVAEGARRGHG